jgi:hypothetical protein
MKTGQEARSRAGAPRRSAWLVDEDQQHEATPNCQPQMSA